MIGWGAVIDKGLSFLQVAWKPLLIGASGIALAHFIWYGPRIDNLKLKLELEREKASRYASVIESQNKAIVEAAEKSKKDFDGFLDQVMDSINARDDDTTEIIERIIEAGKPESCSEATLYLLEQRENLKWSEDQE